MYVTKELDEIKFKSDLEGKKFGKAVRGLLIYGGIALIEMALTHMFGWSSTIFDGIPVILLALWMFYCVSLIKEYQTELEAYKKLHSEDKY